MGNIFPVFESQSAIADIIINFQYDTIPKGLTARANVVKLMKSLNMRRE